MTRQVESPAYEIVRLQSPGDAAPWREAFAAAYRRIFSGEPYNECFTTEQAARVLERAVRVRNHITLLALTPQGDIAGFGIAVPLRARPDVARELTGLVPIQHTCYLAELGVLPEHRHHGLGRRLVLERIKRIDRQQYSHVVLRVALGQEGARELYESMGFEDVGVDMEVVNKRTDGTVRADRRLFMSRVLSQVDLE